MQEASVAWLTKQSAAACSTAPEICHMKTARTGIKLQVLTEDFSKVAFLCADRHICFHARFGAYYSTRVPVFGRDLAYAPFSADLLVVGSASEVYR